MFKQEDIDKLVAAINDMAEMLAANPVAREVYGLTNYKRYKWLIWLLVKLEVLPLTFYVKYCK